MANYLTITDFGAVPDGKTLCTEAFAAAIQAGVGMGGGTVHVPAGTYLTGPIHLESNITLNIEAGAVLLFSQDIKDYPVVFSRWEGVDREVYSPLIYGKNLQNVAVTGRGILDGQGKPWWERFRNESLAYPRPRFISFDNCQNVLIEGVTLTNSPAWTINPIETENLTVTQVTIKNPAESPNTDGINPESCKNVHIANCHIDVGDDCITLKAGTEECSKRVPCENITITNCTMVHGHGGVVIGSEMSGGVRNVVISNCVFEGTDRGIRMKSRRGRGGLIEDIRVNNIVMKDVITPLVMHLYYRCGPGGEDPHVVDRNPQPVDQTTPIFRRIHISNITAREIRAAAAFLYGLPEMPIEDVSFDNISLHLADQAAPAAPAMMVGLDPMAKKGVFCTNVRDVSFSNVTVENADGPAFTIENSANIDLIRCAAKNADRNQPVIQLENTQQVLVQGCKLRNGQTNFLALKGDSNSQIELVGNSKAIN